MEGKSRIVIDTNLLVRSFISSKSYSGDLIREWYKDKFTLLMSEEVYDEAVDVLYRPDFERYHFNQDTIEIFLKTMISKCVLVDTYPFALVPRDSKDAKFLHLALAGDAHFLVSADNDLLALKNHPDIGALKIVTVEEMLDKL